jgi:hypothetical protein
MVTLAALVVAPACASLCAGQNCGQANAPVIAKGSCHGAGSMPRGAAQISGFSNCGSPELIAVVSTSTSIKDASGVLRLSAPDGRCLAVEQENPAPGALFFDFYFGPPHDFSTRFGPVASSVLRI